MKCNCFGTQGQFESDTDFHEMGTPGCARDPAKFSKKSILMWDKPKKVQTVQEWKDHYGFDGGPVGGFMPNMSKNDMAKWKAKLVGTKTGFPQVEIRKTAGSQMLLIVSLGKGYNYKWYTPDRTKRINVHIALNGPAQMTFKEIEEMNLVIEEARTCLKNLVKEKRP